MLEKIKELTFLEDITEESEIHTPKLFKNFYRVYRVKDRPNIIFKIASDWEGNWLAGCWYIKSHAFYQRIERPDELFLYLSKYDIRVLVHHLDILEDISSWNKDKFIGREY